MNSEQLLKSISDLLKKHQDFLNDNPEFVFAIEDRLYKALDDEDEDQDYESYDNNDYNDEDEDSYDNDSHNEMFDKEPNEDDEYDKDVVYQDIDSEDDDASKFLAEAEAAAKKDKQPVKEEAKPVEDKKSSSSGYRDWKPKDSYHPDHSAKMEKLMSEGWSHREAERLIGQHEKGGDPRQSKIRPSEPSAKMFEAVRGQAGDYLKNYERNLSDNADPRKNPVKFANSQNRKAHEEVHGNFTDAMTKFKELDEVKNLRGRDRHNAIKEFTDQWHKANPGHKEKAISVAGKAGTFTDAKKERESHLDEGQKAIAQAGMMGGGSTSSEFSSAASGGEDNMTHQGAMQSVGGSQNDEGGYSSGTVKDPSLHIAQQYPEYAQHLKDKLSSALNHPAHAERKERFGAIKTITRKGKNNAGK